MTKRGVQWVDRSLVDSPYCVGICFDEDGLRREMKRLKVPCESWPGWVDKGKAAHVIELEQPSTGKQVLIVCMTPTKGIDTGAVLGLLAHEAVHVWQAICRDLGEDEPSDEFEAYAIQNISQRLIEVWLKRKGKGK